MPEAARILSLRFGHLKKALVKAWGGNAFCEAAGSARLRIEARAQPSKRHSDLVRGADKGTVTMTGVVINKARSAGNW